MDKNNITVQADLDTRKLEKDLKQFKGSISLTADTNILRKQIDATIKNASKNASISFKCAAPGLNDIIRQTSLAKTQIQSLQQEFAALPQSLNLSVNVNSSGIQQYTAQLKKLTELNGKLQMPTITSAYPKLGTTNPSTSDSLKQADSEGKNFLDTLDKIIKVAQTPVSLFGSNGIFPQYKKIAGSLSKNLD